MTEAFARVSVQDSCEDAQSPGLRAGSTLGAAYELKFQLTPFQAGDLLTWARKHLNPDPHGHNGTYRTTSVYCDTAQLDVYHRTAGYRRSKYRLRRYGDMERVFLERKSKWGDEVKKRRADIAPTELSWLGHPTPQNEWSGSWFHERIQKRSLRPICRVGYHRTAFFGLSAGSPIRVTLDQDLVGAPAADWDVAPLREGVPLLPDAVLLELKFHSQLPPLFRELLPSLPPQPARVSKYRRCIHLCGLKGVNGDLHPPCQEPS